MSTWPVNSNTSWFELTAAVTKELNMRENLKNKDRKLGSPVTTGGVTSILSRMYGKILLELGVGTTGINRLMESHLNNPKNGIPQNLKERASARGNLSKDLTKPTMTWKIFCRLIKFLHVSKFKIDITLYHSNHQPTTHTMLVNLDDDPGCSVFEVCGETNTESDEKDDDNEENPT